MRSRQSRRLRHLRPRFLDLRHVLPRQAVGLGLEVHLFELVVGDFEEVAEGSGHGELLSN